MGGGENGTDSVALTPHAHAQLRSIFSVDALPAPTQRPDAPFVARIHRTKGDGSSPVEFLRLLPL
jgi:hypothetical protein